MTRIFKNALAVLLALLLIPAFSGCGDNTQETAEGSLAALARVNSAGSLYAMVEVTVEDGGGEQETANRWEYWKNEGDTLFYSADPDDESGGKLWYLCYDGAWYSQYTYEVPNGEADTWGYDWTEIEDPHTDIAFWEDIPQTAEEFTFVSEDAAGGTSVLTFQTALTDGDTQSDDGAKLEKALYIFTLDEDGNLPDVEAILSYEDETTYIFHAGFVETDAAREFIEAEAERAGAIG